MIGAPEFTNAKLLASSSVALVDSNMALFDRAGLATIAVTAEPSTAAERSIMRKFSVILQQTCSSRELIVARDCRRARECVQITEL